MRFTGAQRRACAAILVLPLVLAACGDQLTGPSQADGPVDAHAPRAATAAQQITPAGFIRIGVVPSATEITLSADDEFVVTNKETGAALFSGTGDVDVTLLAAGTVDERFWLQVVCTSEAGRDDLVARAQALGYETRTELVSHVPCWRVLLGTLDQGFFERVAFREQAIADGLAGTDSFWTFRSIVTGETQLQVEHGGESKVVDAPVVLAPDDGNVRIDGSPYRGIAEVWTNSGGTLAGINELLLEDYLYGVVPRELPPGPFGEPEAQKAQAVAARTFAVAGLGRRSADGYDLLPTTADQVYGGVAAEHPISTDAVDATADIVAVYEGRLISALYSSTSGGWTANSEDVFISEVPYLRGVPDAERGQALEHVPTLEVFKRHANPTNLRAHAEGDFESDWSRLHRWVVNWSKDEMAAAVNAAFPETVTRVDAVRVVDRADHGRVLRLEIDTDAGTLSAEKDRIRSRLRFFNVNGVLQSLFSTLFFIEEEREPRTRELVGWTAYGGGWGHGVGISQTGAVGMAERGATFEEILKHYYRGIDVVRQAD